MPPAKNSTIAGGRRPFMSLLRPIRKRLRAGVFEGSIRSKTEVGTPPEGQLPPEGSDRAWQGAVISPLLANVYLHYVLDLRVERWRRKHASAAGELSRPPVCRQTGALARARRRAARAPGSGLRLLAGPKAGSACRAGAGPARLRFRCGCLRACLCRARHGRQACDCTHRQASCTQLQAKAGKWLTHTPAIALKKRGLARVESRGKEPVAQTPHKLLDIENHMQYIRVRGWERVNAWATTSSPATATSRT